MPVSKFILGIVVFSFNCIASTVLAQSQDPNENVSQSRSEQPSQFAQRPFFDPDVVFAVPKYPLWLIRLLEPFEIPSMQAELGFAQMNGIAMERDPCAGLRNMQNAASSGNLFAVYWTLSALMVLPDNAGHARGLKWMVYWARLHDWSQEDVDLIAQTFDVSDDVRREIVRNRLQWDPKTEPLFEPDTCPG